ncbi:MAG: hypothetical protein JNM84_11105 [Planctomycetes bacterium]|nr:hypothetical protein [Planctomycetota bacterium]
MRTLPVLVAIASLATVLPAQEPVLSAETACEVFAGTSFVTSRRGFPPGFVVSPEATASSFASGFARLEVRARSQGDRIHLDLDCGASSMGGWAQAYTMSGTGAAAPQSWLWLLPASSSGELRVTSTGSASALVQTWIAVDVDADGTNELQLGGNHSGTIALPLPSPLSRFVRVQLFGYVSLRAAGTEFASQRTTLAFVASGGVVPASFEPIDPTLVSTCGVRLHGADFSGAGHALRFTATNAGSQAPALLMLGATALAPAVPIAGTAGCVLEVLPLVVLPGTTDPLGGVVWSFSAPPVMPGASLFAQAAAIDPSTFALRTSNGVRAQTY